MCIQLTENQLERLLNEAAEMGALHALVKLGKIKLYVNKSQAFQIYGKRNVENWIRQSLIIPIKDGKTSACWRINRVELALVYINTNRSNYL